MPPTSRPFLASLLLRLMSSPFTPSTAAHTSPRRTITEGTDVHLVHFCEMPSPPHRNTSPPTSRPFLASPSAPSDVFTIHTIDSRSPPRHVEPSPKGRAATSSTSGRCHRHHLATTSPPIDQQPDGQPRRLSVILPASSSSPSSSPPSGGEGRAESQPWWVIPSRSSCRPSPPCRGASAYWRTPSERGRAAGCHLRAAGVVFEKVCFGIFFTVVSL